MAPPQNQLNNGMLEYWEIRIFKIDGLVKSRNSIEFVILAKAGIQGSR